MADDQRIKYEDLPERYKDEAVAKTTEILADQPATALDLARLESDLQDEITSYHRYAAERDMRRDFYPGSTTTTIRETPTVAYWALGQAIVATIVAILAIIF